MTQDGSTSSWEGFPIGRWLEIMAAIRDDRPVPQEAIDAMESWRASRMSAGYEGVMKRALELLQVHDDNYEADEEPDAVVRVNVLSAMAELRRALGKGAP